MKLVTLDTLHWYCEGLEPTEAAHRYDRLARQRKSVTSFFLFVVTSPNSSLVRLIQKWRTEREGLILSSKGLGGRRREQVHPNCLLRGNHLAKMTVHLRNLRWWKSLSLLFLLKGSFLRSSMEKARAWWWVKFLVMQNALSFFIKTLSMLLSSSHPSSWVKITRAWATILLRPWGRRVSLVWLRYVSVCLFFLPCYFVYSFLP